MTARTYTALFPFGGIGGGALGFARAHARLFGREASFRIVGGIDFDAASCRDFTMLTGAPTLCADIAALTPAGLRELSPECPDVVFLSPPCKGASGLLSAAKAKTAKYRAMNRLALRWLELMLATWTERPKLVLLENVPRLRQRAGGMLRRVRKLLRAAGYVFTDGFHDCGELGGLAQVRRRYLLVARHAATCPPLLYQPPRKRVRACGEVLGPMPLPGAEEGGPMHRLPRLSWLNWVRLALIPAGGDWRDLDDVLRTGQPRREVFRRHHVEKWTEPSVTIAGTGSNGPSGVADPRPKEWFGNVLRVQGWDEPAGTVTASPSPSSGGGCVADPRLGAKLGQHHSKMRVEDWDRPAHTITGSDRVGSGAPSVADPRFAACDCGHAADDHGGGTGAAADWCTKCSCTRFQPWAEALRVKAAFDHGYGVLSFNEPSPTVAGGSAPGQGAYSVADERFRGSYGVLDWEEPAGTITGNARPPTGKFSVADLRFGCEMRAGTYGVLSWQEAAASITGSACHDNGAFSVADPRKPPPRLPIIIAADGTWHRPLTTLELAALQGFPTVVDGKPLKLDGDASGAWRERIGNAVPPPAAQAIAERMLVALLQAELGGFSLASPDTPVWISPEDRAHG